MEAGRLEYDPEANAIYYTLSDKSYAYSRDLDPERTIDYAADGTPIGVEVTCVRSGVDVGGLPEADAIAAEFRRLNIPIVQPAG